MTRPARPIPARHLRPPMGWNSWDCYGTTVTEEEVLANAAFMREPSDTYCAADPFPQISSGVIAGTSH